LVTIHRAENTLDKSRLKELVEALISLQEPVVLPLHPRTRKALELFGLSAALRPGSDANLRITDPLGYLDMVRLVSSARMVLTDSGGLQKEAYWLGVPCVTLREETEWVETIQAGWNLLAGTNIEKIIQAVCEFSPPSERPPLYGDGHAAKRCVEIMLAS
jgi:UDP-GlcNAc3NAcA epimerase